MTLFEIRSAILRAFINVDGATLHPYREKPTSVVYRCRRVIELDGMAQLGCGS